MDPLRRQTQLGYADALARIPALLQEEGFGVLTRIDVKDTMKQKLGVDFRPYTILGACNPALAHRVLSAELAVGVMLPCNVVVYEDDAGEAVVLAIDPMQTMAAGDARIEPVAREVRDRLARVLQRL
jgi:uncharacterized protein (DUF302 family)